jgi:hypothetical protein
MQCTLVGDTHRMKTWFFGTAVMAGMCLGACISEDELLGEYSAELAGVVDNVDDVGDSRTEAARLGAKYFGDEINKPADVDWFFIVNDGVAHPNSKFTVWGKQLKCAAFHEDDFAAMWSSRSNANDECKVVFQTIGTRRYYVRVWLDGTAWVEPRPFIVWYQA